MKYVRSILRDPIEEANRLIDNSDIDQIDDWIYGMFFEPDPDPSSRLFFILQNAIEKRTAKYI